MVLNPVRSAVGLLAVLAVSTLASLHAEDKTAEDALKSHGLRKAGVLYVLEAETDVRNKMNAAQKLSRLLKYARMQQRMTASPEEYQQTVKGLNDQIQQYRSEINLVSARMSQFPRSSGSFRGGYVNNSAMGQYNQLLAYRNELQAEVNQMSYFLNQLKTQPVDPESRKKLDAEVRDREGSYHQALLELRKLVDSTTEKYAELAKNETVKKALEKLGRHAGSTLKLGPSPSFTNTVKLLEKIEKAESDGPSQEPQAKPARRTRSSTKGKRGSGSESAATKSPGGAAQPKSPS
jgi:hypothetical protein